MPLVLHKSTMQMASVMAIKNDVFGSYVEGIFVSVEVKNAGG